MEVVGAIASVSQLLSYSFSASKLLLQLVKDIETGPTAHRHKVDDIRLLELLIEDIVKTPTGFSHAQEEVLIPVVIQISTATDRIRNLIHALGSFSLIAIWTNPSQNSAIDAQFKTLKSKGQILSLYLVQDIRREMSGFERRSEQPEENSEGTRSRPQGVINISGNKSKTDPGARLNAGVATKQPLAEEINITDNDNWATFASVLNTGVCDDETFKTLFEKAMMYAPEPEEHKKTFIAAVGKKMNNLLAIEDRGGDFWQNVFTQVPQVAEEVRRELHLDLA